MAKTITIDDEVAGVLRHSVTDGMLLRLPQLQLERPLYERTNKVLEAIGGKWSRSYRAHVFTRPVAEVLAAALDEGAVENRQQTLQFFQTPPALAAEMAPQAWSKVELRAMIEERFNHAPFSERVMQLIKARGIEPAGLVVKVDHAAPGPDGVVERIIEAPVVVDLGIQTEITFGSLGFAVNGIPVAWERLQSKEAIAALELRGWVPPGIERVTDGAPVPCSLCNGEGVVNDTDPDREPVTCPQCGDKPVIVLPPLPIPLAPEGRFRAEQLKIFARLAVEMDREERGKRPTPFDPADHTYGQCPVCSKPALPAERCTWLHDPCLAKFLTVGDHEFGEDRPDTPKPGIYRHHKGEEYEVIGCFRHSETGEIFVGYKGRRGWAVRPRPMFVDTVAPDTLRFAFIRPIDKPSPITEAGINSFVDHLAKLAELKDFGTIRETLRVNAMRQGWPSVPPPRATEEMAKASFAERWRICNGSLDGFIDAWSRQEVKDNWIKTLDAGLAVALCSAPLTMADAAKWIPDTLHVIEFDALGRWNLRTNDGIALRGDDLESLERAIRAGAAPAAKRPLRIGDKIKHEEITYKIGDKFREFEKFQPVMFDTDSQEVVFGKTFTDKGFEWFAHGSNHGVHRLIEIKEDKR